MITGWPREAQGIWLFSGAPGAHIARCFGKKEVFGLSALDAQLPNQLLARHSASALVRLWEQGTGQPGRA